MFQKAKEDGSGLLPLAEAVEPVRQLAELGLRVETDQTSRIHTVSGKTNRGWE